MELTYEVYHGDCFKRLADLPDKSVTLILTDPPYGHQNNEDDLIARWELALGENRKRPNTTLAVRRKGDNFADPMPRPIHNDTPEKAEALFDTLVDETSRPLAPVGCCCCCGGGGGPDPQFARWSMKMDSKLQYVQMLIWDKGPIGMGWRYRRSYETVLVATRRGGRMPWYDNSDKIENIIRPGAYGIKKILPSKNQHPTQKPVELFELFIRLHTKPGDLVVDPFCGSGSSGVAAKKLGRSWLGCDTDIRWVEMTRRRLAATTSRLPELMEAERAELEEMERQGVFAECSDDTQGASP